MRVLALLSVLLFVSPCYAGSLVGPVSDESVEPIIKDLAAAPDFGRVDVLLDTPGGSVGAGMVLIDAMRAAKRRGVAVVCIVDGQASSMGAYLLQVCTVRAMTKGSYLLFHAPRTQTSGTAWDIARTAGELKVYERMFAIIATGRMKMSVGEFEERIKDKDWVLSPSEALALGAVDVVLP